ncbi:hypothetical protein GCM10010400_46570 [Streptomyces aculeolatus]
MAIRTHWTVEHSCTHETVHDLSDRPADRRAGFARWLAERDCPDCWKAARDADSGSRQEWLAAAPTSSRLPPTGRSGSTCRRWKAPRRLWRGVSAPVTS